MRWTCLQRANLLYLCGRPYLAVPSTGPSEQLINASRHLRRHRVRMLNALVMLISDCLNQHGSNDRRRHGPKPASRTCVRVRAGSMWGYTYARTLCARQGKISRAAGRGTRMWVWMSAYAQLRSGPSGRPGPAGPFLVVVCCNPRSTGAL